MARNFPDFLQAYMEYSKYSEAPDKFHFWTGVSVVAGALRRRVWIEQHYFQWVPNFYIIFVAPPGIVSKSTTAAIGMDLLKKVDGINFGPEALTWQALTKSLSDNTEAWNVEDEDGNTKILRQSALTIMASEMGTLLNPNDREMVDAFVSLWDGRLGEWRKSTKCSGDDVIMNPWINMLACTTPAWISGAFPEYMIGGGFTSRSIFVYAEEKRQLIAYPKRNLPEGFDEIQEMLVEDLQDIAEMCGEMTLSEEAELWGEQWYEEHYKNRPAHLDNERFGGYIARKQTHIHKLAIVLAASRSSELVIQKDTLQAAAEIITSLESEMPKVFSNIGVNQEGKQTSALLQYIQKVGKVEQKVLFREMIREMNYNQFKAAIDSGVNAGMIKILNDGGTVYLMRANYKIDD